MTVSDQPKRDEALRLRRLDGVSNGRPEDGRTDEYELICSDCGDDPRRAFREVPAELQQVRGPYPLIAGIEAFTEHSESHGNLSRGARAVLAGPARNPGTQCNSRCLPFQPVTQCVGDCDPP